jgi:hypothetical protein
MVGASGDSTDTLFYIELDELRNNLPQTAWTPTVSIAGLEDVLNTQAPTQDGAGPVIWKVVKEVKNVDDHTNDIVTVTFSEDLDRVPGSSDKPGVVFVVWTVSGGDTIATDTLLAGIDFFLVSNTDNVAKFQMVNNRNLTGNNFMSIRVTAGVAPPVVDASSGLNAPNANNRKVRVVINSTMTVRAGPNPMVPNSRLRNDANLIYQNPRKVAQDAYQNGGTAFLVSIQLPSDTEMTLEGELLVYDVAGNLVHYRPSNGPIENLPEEWKSQAGTTQDLGVYWNGFNDQRMRCSPGVYRAIVKMTAEYRLDGQRKTERLAKVVAIGVGR